MTTIQDTPTSHLALFNASPPQTAPITPQEAIRHNSRGLSLFGKDGFTFFDFLDMINPLQHIPVISAMYRSITGDQIDPGARIAGGTIFGGPLGAALATMDVAIKHKTGQDISEHAVTFFAQNNGNNHNDRQIATHTSETRSVQIASATENIRPKEAGMMRTIANSVSVPRPLAPTATETSTFKAAGMTSIPIAKQNMLRLKQSSSYAPPRVPDLGLVGHVKQPTSQHQTLSNYSNEFVALKPPQGPVMSPYKLTPRYSEPDNLELTRTLGPTGTQRQNKLSDPGQTIAHNKNGWVFDAMLRGLGKYESAVKMTNFPLQSKLSVTR